MIALSLILAALASATAPSAAPTIKDVGWITGCWELDRNGRHIVEHWLPPEGGSMMGVSRTVSGDKTIEWEFLIIREAANGLEYVAQPSRQPTATFTAASAAANEISFTNPAHDFPQRITYTRSGDGLNAATEGTIDGRARRIEFPYKKASCGS